MTYYYNGILSIRKKLLILVLILNGLTVVGQKLPNVQTGNLWVSNKININGNLSDWPNGFKAHNNATDFYYTIANDEKDLYVVLQARYSKIILNILNGGVTIAIKTANGDPEKDKSITYPVFDRNSPMYVNIKGKPILADSSKKEVAKLDSFVSVTNLRLGQKAKNIKLSNFEGIDPIISVFNEEEIKVSSLFNRDMYYTIELAIPLKYLKLTSSQFKYQIKINDVEGRGLKITTDAQTGAVTSFSAISSDVQAGQSATYFNGEYILAQKP